jgi:hypothetical protein
MGGLGLGLSLSNSNESFTDHVVSSTYTVYNATDDGTTISAFTSSTSITTFVSIQQSSNNNAFAGAAHTEGSGIKYQLAYFRFTNVLLEQGEVVDSAVLRAYRETLASGDSVDFRVAAIDTDNAPVPSAGSDLNVANHTTAGVTLPRATIAAVNNNNTFDSPNINTVVQEVVNRPSWSSGNSINIVVYTPTNVNSSSAVRVGLGTKYGSEDHAAQLLISA